METPDTDQFSHAAEVFVERARRVADLTTEFGNAAVIGNIPGMQRALENYREALREIEKSFEEILVAISALAPIPGAN